MFSLLELSLPLFCLPSVRSAGGMSMMPEFRLGWQVCLLAWVELAQDLRLRLVHGQEGMAGIAVLRDFTSLL